MNLFKYEFQKPEMPEESKIDLQRTLDLLEDPIMEKPLAISHYFKVFLKALENDSNISLPVLNRILSSCAVELQDNKKCCYLAMKIISLVLKKIKVLSFVSRPYLVMVYPYLGSCFLYYPSAGI